ncbi:hypothetical protein [Salinicola sp. CR57]|uniref:hypothetical protein n=1 Tax=Salinicola sp. CR57 TaxID=1949086 RepID=UPI000DA11E1D|nr:hypothetical protein [Salinicola sp. CR57]
MAQINREGTVRFGDASLNIWEEPNGSVWGEWGRLFKVQVFKRIIQQLNRLGWTVGPWDKAEQFAAIADSHRTCRKGNLQGQLELSGRCIKFEMWQDVANIDREDGQGRYEFDKEKRMPYLLWLEMERTRRRLRDYLCNVFSGYEFNDSPRDGRNAKRGPGALTAMEWVNQETRNCWHYDHEIGRRGGEDRCGNNRSADGATIRHGSRVYTTDYSGRMVVGIAHYNINNMWWVVTGKYGVTNETSFCIYVNSPGDLRRKRNEGRRRKRLEQELAKAVKAMDFRRAEKLKHILFPAGEQLYLIWHKGHGAYHGAGASGYTSNPIDAGKFTWDELGRFRPSDGSMEDSLSKIVPACKAGEAVAA